MKPLITISVLLTLFISSCGSREDEPTELDKTSDSIVGVWLSSSYIHKEFTRLNDDGSVEVFHQQVSGEPYSKGEWEIRDDGYFYWRFTHILVDGAYKEVEGDGNWAKLRMKFSDGGGIVTFTRQLRSGVKVSRPTFSWERIVTPST